MEQSVQVVARLKPVPVASLSEAFNVDLKARAIEVRNRRKPEYASIGGAVDNTADWFRFQTHDVLFNAQQSAVFDACASDLIDDALERGISSALLAYGQTGSGKTHTMVGPRAGPYDSRGIIPRAISRVMQAAATAAPARRLQVRLSCVEIYQEAIIDLLRSELQLDADTGMHKVAPSSAASGAAAAAAVAAAMGGTAYVPVGGGAAAAAALSRGSSSSGGPPPSPTKGALRRSTSLGSGDAPDASPATGGATAGGGSGGAGGKQTPRIVEDKRGRVRIRGLSAPAVTSEADALNAFFLAEGNRAIAEHALNKGSTRSHCIFTIQIEQQMVMTQQTSAVAVAAGGSGSTGATSAASTSTGSGSRWRPATEEDEEQDDESAADKLDASTASAGAASTADAANKAAGAGGSKAGASATSRPATVVSRIYLVDLAGSERVEKSESEGLAKREAGHINRSLSFLEQVVIALLEKGRDHIPFRSSKLTHVLKDCFLRGRTRLIATLWPDPLHADECIATLRFAARMMRLKTTPLQDVLGSGAGGSGSAWDDVERARVVATYEREISLLRTELALQSALRGDAVGGGGGSTSTTYAPLNSSQLAEVRQAVAKFTANPAVEPRLPTVRHYIAALAQLRDEVVALQEQVRVLSSPVSTSRLSARHVSSTATASSIDSSSSVASSRMAAAAAATSVAATTSTPAPTAPAPKAAGAAVAGAVSPAPRLPPLATELVAATSTGTSASAATAASLRSASRDSLRIASAAAAAEPARPPPALTAAPASSPLSPAAPVVDTARFNDAAARTAELQRWRATPASAGGGADLHSEYATAKDSLKERKAAYSACVADVNAAKASIDKLLDELKALPPGDASAAAAGGGDPAAAVSAALAQAKAAYRAKYDALNEVKREVDYLQRMSETVGQQIATAFQEHWTAVCSWSVSSSGGGGADVVSS